MKVKPILGLVLASSLLISCGKTSEDKARNTIEEVIEVSENSNSEFDYTVEQFADIKVLRYKIHGFDALTLKEQKLVYYLTQAGLAGRDIMWDQNYRHNLSIRKA